MGYGSTVGTIPTNGAWGLTPTQDLLADQTTHAPNLGSQLPNVYAAAPTGDPVKDTLALQTAINKCIGPGAPTTVRTCIAACILAPGTYIVNVQLDILSVEGFHLQGAGREVTYIAGTGTLDAVLNIDGCVGGLFEDFSILGSGTHFFDKCLSLQWSGSGTIGRSSSGNTVRNLYIRNASFRAGFSIGSRTANLQCDDTSMYSCTVNGFFSRRVITDGAIVNGQNTLTSTQAAWTTADIGRTVTDYYRGAYVPAGTTILSFVGNVATMSANATFTTTITFTIADATTSQIGFEIGSGSSGNILNTNLYHCSSALVKWGFHFNATNGSVTGADVGHNQVDFYISGASPAIGIRNVRSETSARFLYATTTAGAMTLTIEDIVMNCNAMDPDGAIIYYPKAGTITIADFIAAVLNAQFPTLLPSISVGAAGNRCIVNARNITMPVVITAGLVGDANTFWLVENYWQLTADGQTHVALTPIWVQIGTGTPFALNGSGTVATIPSTAAAAGLRLGHGAAPTAPVDGDMWSTTAGLFIRINGVTKTVTLT